MNIINNGYYLAHPTASRKEIREWELDTERRTGFPLTNPFYDVCPKEMAPVDAGKMSDWDLPHRELVECDIGSIGRSRGLVGIIDSNFTYGTIQEIVYAKKVFNLPVFLIVTNGKEDHPWLKYHSNAILTSFHEAAEFFNNFHTVSAPITTDNCAMSRLMKQVTSEGITGDYYLAHPLATRKRSREWELSFEKETGIRLINPFYDLHRKEIEIMDRGEELSSAERPSPRDVVERDIFLIEQAKRGLVAIIDQSLTYGTLMEMVYAKKVMNKEVHLIVTNGKERHPFLRYHSNSIHPSFEAFKDFARTILI